MFKPITRLLTKNLKCIPLLYITFNMKKFKKYGANDSCELVIHPVLKNDEYIISTMEKLCDYIRKTYDMDSMV